MRLSRVAPALAALGLLQAACNSGFDATLQLDCTNPAGTNTVRVGESIELTATYSTFDPTDHEWSATPGAPDEFSPSTFTSDPTNEGETESATTIFTPSEVGTVQVLLQSPDLDRTCEVEVLPEDAPDPVTITVSVVGMGQVTSSPEDIDCPGTCSASVLPGTQVTLTPTPAADWRLDAVTGGCAASGADYVVTPDADVTCVFTFVDDSGPPDNQVRIAPGAFTRGCTVVDCPGYEVPANPVTLTATYDIDKFEVTVAEYALCVDAGDCTEPVPAGAMMGCTWMGAGTEDHPVNCVDYDQARAFCQWRGMDLPTEAQWERAARGDEDARLYPWGDEAPDCTRGNGTVVDPFMRCSSAPVAVGQYPDGMSPFGVYDMCGNVEEWTLDWFGGAYYAEGASQVDPEGPAAGSVRMSRGGNYKGFARVYDRTRQLAPNTLLPELGFRCANTL